jgi:hypothetical protein
MRMFAAHWEGADKEPIVVSDASFSETYDGNIYTFIDAERQVQVSAGIPIFRYFIDPAPDEGIHIAIRTALSTKGY